MSSEEMGELVVVQSGRPDWGFREGTKSVGLKNSSALELTLTLVPLSFDLRPLHVTAS